MLAPLAFVPGTLGCQQIIGIDFDDAEPRPEATACERTLPPERPDVVGAGGDVSFAVVVASLDMSEDETADGTPQHLVSGFDIDENCANRGETPICQPQSWTSGDPTDGAGGEDNAVGKLLFDQVKFLGAKALTSELLNARLTEGTHAPLGVIRVSDYGGLADDDQVTVDWYSAHQPEVVGLMPKFDGTDRWPIFQGAVDGTATPEMGDPDVLDFPPARERDANAYVSRFRLVARMGQATISFSNFYFQAFGVVLSGNLERDTVTLQWKMTDAVISGRSRADTLVEMLPVGAFETAGVTLCPGNPNYEPVKQLVCSVADTVLDDQVEPAGQCGATSFAMKFDAVATTLGPVLPDAPRSQPCPPDQDPADDSCRFPSENPIVFGDDAGP